MKTILRIIGAVVLLVLGGLAFLALKKPAQQPATSEKIERTPSAQLRESIYNDIRFELEIHASAEEAVLYPRARKIDELRALEKRSEKEHTAMRNCVRELDRFEANSDEWRAGVSRLRLTVEQHVRAEEGWLFPKLRELRTEVELKEWGEELELAKQRLLSAA